MIGVIIIGNRDTDPYKDKGGKEKVEDKEGQKGIEENELILPNEAKVQYLSMLIGKVIKILHLIEEEKNTGYTPKYYIHGLIWDINSLNSLMNWELTEIIVKLKSIYDNFDKAPFEDIKKKVFEIKSKINFLIRKFAK